MRQSYDQIYRGKMDYNCDLMLEGSKTIAAATERLQAAIHSGVMDDMNSELKLIVDAAIGCRSRLQFMRGVWSVIKDLKMEAKV